MNESGWVPWTGHYYSETRLLLLGESAYPWTEGNKLVQPSSKHSIELVEEAIQGTSTLNFIKTISRALAGEYQPNRERLRFVWDRVAFTNYVPGIVLRGARNGPTTEMWATAKKLFPSLLSTLEPRRIIVLGREMWSKMPDAEVHFTDDVQGYRLQNGNTAICWALNHPSGGLSWQQLAAVIQFVCIDELRER